MLNPKACYGQLRTEHCEGGSMVFEDLAVQTTGAGLGFEIYLVLRA